MISASICYKQLFIIANKTLKLSVLFRSQKLTTIQHKTTTAIATSNTSNYSSSLFFSKQITTLPANSKAFLRYCCITAAILFTSATTNVTFALSINKKMTDCKGVSGAFLESADKLFDSDKFDELATQLKAQPKWEENEQVLWRLARCEFQQAKKIKDSDKTGYQTLVDAAYEHVKQSLVRDEKNGLAHKWAAILLNEVSSLKGTKERVLQVLNVRTHMEKAVEYAPTDATSYYLLGEWHFSCYQVSWIEKKIASIAFGKLPDADMEVALKMFQKAEEIDKDFYSKNKLMLAKTLLELKRHKDRAIELLKDVSSKYASSDKWDDKEAVTEANKLLRSMGASS